LVLKLFFQAVSADTPAWRQGFLFAGALVQPGDKNKPVEPAKE